MDIIIGKNEAGDDIFLDFNDDPHVMITGQTGSGKSNFLHLMIQKLSEGYSAEEVDCILVDTKRVDFLQYRGSLPIVSGVEDRPNHALLALQWMAYEMERRQGLLRLDNVQNIQSFNAKKELGRKMSHIFYIVDECSDLMRDEEGDVFKDLFVRIAQMGGGVGLHIILSTSCAATDIYTDKIKNNIACRLAFPMMDKAGLANFFWSKNAQMETKKGSAWMQTGANDLEAVKIQVELSSMCSE